MPATLTFSGTISQIKNDVVEFAARFSGDQLLEIASQPASADMAEALLTEVALVIGYEGSNQTLIPSLVANLKLELDQANRRQSSLAQEVESLAADAKPSRRKKKEVPAPNSGLTAESGRPDEVRDQPDSHMGILAERSRDGEVLQPGGEVASLAVPAGAEQDKPELGLPSAPTLVADGADEGGARLLTTEEHAELVEAFRQQGVTDPRANTMMQAHCGVSSSRELTVPMRDQLLNVLQTGAAKVPF
jgi:hypothetical protein